MEGVLWIKTVPKFPNKIFMPISIYFDDYETGDTLSSHSGIDKLGLFVSFFNAYHQSIEVS